MGRCLPFQWQEPINMQCSMVLFFISILRTGVAQIISILPTLLPSFYNYRDTYAIKLKTEEHLQRDYP